MTYITSKSLVCRSCLSLRPVQSRTISSIVFPVLTLFGRSSKTHLSARLSANESACLQSVQIGRGAFLALFILLYNFCHKFFNAAPWLMGAGRFWVYVIAGAAGAWGLNGWAIFGGLALAFYVVGLSYVARRESYSGPIPFWPLLLLAAPIILALAMNTGSFRWRAIWISIVLILWVGRSVRTIYIGGGGNVGLIVANLLAGFVFVDWIAIAPDGSRWLSLLLLALFGLTKWLQKFVPAT